MSFKSFKGLIQNLQKLVVTNIQEKKQLKDEAQECLQFGICTVQAKSPKPEELYFR